MSEWTPPERVDVHLCKDCGSRAHCYDRCPADRRRKWTQTVAIPYVPESRLTAVERERDALRARVEELKAALREMVDCLDRHDGWCGHSLGSPGDGIINEAPRHARAALEKVG